MERAPPSGISILVIGGGPGGLAFAIEAYRKGHDVRVLERRKEFDNRGSILGIQASAARHFAKWPGFLKRLAGKDIKPVCRMMKYDFTRIGDFPASNPNYPAMPLTRPTLHGALNDYAQELNIKIEWDTAATKFFEDHNSAGVILADGRVETADLVVAADGIGSKSWELVNGCKPTYIDSGLTCHVATCPADVVHKNKVIAGGFGDFERGMLFSLGPGMHFGMGRTEEDISWTMVHKTRKNHSETAVEWGKGGTHESALSYCEGWAPFYKEIVKATPSDEILLWNLTWRDPHPNWVSSRGRVIQLGDSAHPFIPTSGAGATMAIEDAYSLAACLQLGGKPNIPLALKVHNRLRFERVSCAQKNAFRNSEKFHNTDWDAVAKDPGMSANFTGDWLSSHNVEQYTYDNYEKVVSHIVMGNPFENTNTPPGYTFKPWSIKEMMDASERGQPITDEGEWS